MLKCIQKYRKYWLIDKCSTNPCNLEYSLVCYIYTVKYHFCDALNSIVLGKIK